MRSSLSGGFALFPTFLGQSRQSQQPLQISHLAAKKKLLFVISVKSLLLTRS